MNIETLTHEIEELEQENVKLLEAVKGLNERRNMFKSQLLRVKHKMDISGERSKQKLQSDLNKEQKNIENTQQKIREIEQHIKDIESKIVEKQAQKYDLINNSQNQRLTDLEKNPFDTDTFNIFYSWQSTTSGKHNRNFIQDALKKTVKDIKRDDTLNIEPVLDRDTQGVSGGVNIAQIIFQKIKYCQIFVCDVTIVTDETDSIQTPNPNVMVELGYAAGVIGWEKIILIANEAFGKVEELPFDIRQHRILTYSYSTINTDKSIIRENLKNHLKGAIQIILDKEYSSDSKSSE